MGPVSVGEAVSCESDASEVRVVLWLLLPLHELSSEGVGPVSDNVRDSESDSS